MNRGIYAAITGMISQEAKQGIITNNLANVNTVGFKQDNLATKQFKDVLLQNYDKMVAGKNVRNPIGTLSYGSKIDEIATDFTQGTINSTDKDTDFAIEGRGFFTVERNDGVSTNRYITRDGHFHVNTQGYLVNDSGDKVLARNSSTGAVEPINVGNGKLKSTPDGNISIDGVQAYKFYTVDVNDMKSLVKMGDNLYSGGNPVESNAVVRQNALEKSNVNVVSEMVNLMEVMRTFETNQKIVQSIDETLGKAVNEVGSLR